MSLPPSQVLPWPLQKSGWSHRIALINEHASPFGKLGSVDSGGQNQYVSHLARQLSVLGYRVDIFTRRDSELVPDVAAWSHGVRIIHVNAGPTEPVPEVTVSGRSRWRRASATVRFSPARRATA